MRDRPAGPVLAAHIAAGDADAFRAFFDAEVNAAVRYAAGILGSWDDGRDVVQEAFFRIWRDRRRLDPTRDPTTLLYTITRNLARDALRHRAIEQRPRDIGEPSSDDTDAPDIEAALHRAVAELPPRQREIVLLRWHRQLTYEEISAELGIAAGTVAAHMQRAIAQLRERLPKLLDDLGR